MKKWLKQAGSLAIASSLLLSAIPHAFAEKAVIQSNNATTLPAFPVQDDGKQIEASITKERALELAKTYIAIPTGFTLQSVSLNSYYGNGGRSFPTWNIHYTKKVKDQYYGNLSVSINGLDGSLTSYSINDNDPEHKPSYPPKVDFKRAKEVATAWIAKVNPSKQKELIYNDAEENAFRTPLNGNYQYNIRFDRAVGDVPFMQNGINVSVNGEGQVTGYNFNWDDKVTFEQKVTPISQEKAEQLFHDKANLSLQYQIPYGMKGKKTPIISYALNAFSLNAASGELWNPGTGSAPPAGGEKPLTDKPLADKPPATLNLTKEQAAEKVVSAFNISTDLKLQEASYNESTNPETGETESTWNLNWSQPAEKDPKGKIMGSGAWASVNSKTGEILNFNSYMAYGADADKEVEGKVSLDDAKTTAVNFVKKYLPAYTDQLVLNVPAAKDYPEEQLKHMHNWDIHFNRVIDGVTAGHESVNVSIDRTTGKIVSFYFSISDLPYPKKKPEVLAVDKAKDLLLSKYDIKLNYVLTGSGPILYGMPIEKYNVMVAAGEIAPTAAAGTTSDKLEAKLVYSLIPKYTREGFLLDAQTGQWKNADTGEVISFEKVKVNDIDNHWARNELQLMLDYQALDVKDGKVNPDQTITRGELIKMLVIAMNGGNGGIYYGAERKASFADVSNSSAYFAYVENAVDRGLLDPGADFNPEAKMDREEMGELIVKALGYKSLTKFDGIFNTSFADAGKLENVGAAAIVLGLGIMSLNDDKFEPQQEVSKAQAASAFFRFLQKRAELQEQPRYYY
ncbi:S-layer homology domain-containing protein [Paenibacillus sedimenti]|uniref:S-layer homology domain-containing protein n=1 Tax=Paenibacillus sedimenti TaxID=2770274 RepID=A0A926KSC7_9BACL|nr:S-layer homology domain-containing protein [Paenibacillus sedimenti]MBD0382011.1 S-layer homology domain-containing protein [Paenibacillus sedimenti]